MFKRAGSIRQIGLWGMVALASSCGAAEEPVTVTFSARVGDAPLRCGQTYSGLGSSASDFTVGDLRFYIHGVNLITADGRDVPLALDQQPKWQKEDVVLLDFEDGSATCESGTPETNSTVVGTAPPGDYTGVRFTLGVPFALNHANAATAAAPLNLTSMFWNWNKGYKFLRVDGTTPGLESWVFHLGSTACEGDNAGNVTDCDNPNRPQISFDEVRPTSDSIIFDLAGLLSGADLESKTTNTPAGCMSGLTDPDCEVYFNNMGMPWNGSEAPKQQVFRVE